MCHLRLSAAVLALASASFMPVVSADVTIQENAPGFCSYDGVISTANNG